MMDVFLTAWTWVVILVAFGLPFVSLLNVLASDYSEERGGAFLRGYASGAVAVLASAALFTLLS